MVWAVLKEHFIPGLEILIVEDDAYEQGNIFSLVVYQKDVWRRVILFSGRALNRPGIETGVDRSSAFASGSPAS